MAILNNIIKILKVDIILFCRVLLEKYAFLT